MEKIEPISDEDYNRIITECLPHINKLKLIVQSTNELPEGGSYYKHKTFEPMLEKIPCQKNLMTLAKLSQNILEIGFNMGHSALFMLIANPNCKIDCIDICEHIYTQHCFNYLSTVFSNRIRLLKGSSHSVLENYEEPDADLCHIDGNHEFHTANIDFFLSKDKVKIGGFIVFDDTWLYHLMNLWKGYLHSKIVSEVEICPQNFDCIETVHSIGRLTGPKLKITVCTLAIGQTYKNYVKYGHLGKIKYCKMHHYELRDDEDIYDNTRPCAWSKIKLIAKCLNENKSDYIVWLDADTHIMNFNLKLEHFISRLSNNKDILVAQDSGNVDGIPCQVNSGVMFIKNSEWSKSFFNTLYEQKQFLYHPNWDQGAFIHMYKTNMQDSQNHITVLSPELQTEFNSYYSQYKHGQFLVHLAGCYRDNKNNGLDSMMDMFCPLRMEKDTEETYINRMKFLNRI